MARSLHPAQQRVDSAKRLIAAALIALLSLFTLGAHAATLGEARAQCEAALAVPCWAAAGPGCSGVCDVAGEVVFLKCPGSQNGGASCTSTMNIVQAFPFDENACALPSGTETSSGVSRSGLQSGALGCDAASNCQTQFETTDNINLNGTSMTAGRFVTTGQTCGVAEEPDDDLVSEEECDQQGGFTVCVSEDETCVTASTGRKFCWTNNPGSGCDKDFDDALCRDAPPPDKPDGRDDWEREDGPVTISRNGDDTTFVSYTNGADSDNDGDPDDEDEDDDGDGTEDEDDDEEEEREASLSGCGAEPSCSGDPIDCAHYVTSWRHRCDADDDRASGGASCASPPSCTGDPIQCAQLSQTWRIRCDAEGKVTGGNTCDAEPACTGDPLRCALVRQQWLLRCKSSDVTGGQTCASPPSCTGNEAQCAMVETNWRIACQGVISGGQIGNCNAPPTCDAGSAQCASVKALWRIDCQLAEGLDEPPELPGDEELFGAAGEPGQGVATVIPGAIAGLDDDGWGWSRSCPLVGQVSLGSWTVPMPTDLICNALAILGALIFIGGIAQAAYILGRSS